VRCKVYKSAIDFLDSIEVLFIKQRVRKLLQDYLDPEINVNSILVLQKECLPTAHRFNGYDPYTLEKKVFQDKDGEYIILPIKNITFEIETYTITFSKDFLEYADEILKIIESRQYPFPVTFTQGLLNTFGSLNYEYKKVGDIEEDEIYESRLEEERLLDEQVRIGYSQMEDAQMEYDDHDD
jgi:hypothetical protein